MIYNETVTHKCTGTKLCQQTLFIRTKTCSSRSGFGGNGGGGDHATVKTTIGLSLSVITARGRLCSQPLAINLILWSDLKPTYRIIRTTKSWYLIDDNLFIDIVNKVNNFLWIFSNYHMKHCYICYKLVDCIQWSHRYTSLVSNIYKCITTYRYSTKNVLVIKSNMLLILCFIRISM